MVKNLVLLQYPKKGEPGVYGRPTDSEAEKFVDLDSSTGGYPFGTTIDMAYDFKTIEEALKCQRHFPQLIVRRVRVTYEVMHHEP